MAESEHPNIKDEPEVGKEKELERLIANEKKAQKDEQLKNLILDRIETLNKYDIVIKILSDVSNRYNNTNNPIIKYSLYLDKFITAFEIASAVIVDDDVLFAHLNQFEGYNTRDLNGLDEYSKLEAKKATIKEKISALSNLTRNHLIEMNEWIQNDKKD